MSPTSKCGNSLGAQMTESGSVQIEGDTVVIRIPIDRAHGLRVALNECPCVTSKSTATQGIRGALRKALAAAETNVRVGR